MPVVRVDIIIVKSGKFAMNKYESLGAMTYVSVGQTQLNTGRAADADNDAKVSIFRLKVWVATIKMNFDGSCQMKIRILFDRTTPGRLGVEFLSFASFGGTSGVFIISL